MEMRDADSLEHLGVLRVLCGEQSTGRGGAGATARA